MRVSRKLTEEQEAERQFVKNLLTGASELGAEIRIRKLNRGEIRYMADFPNGGMLNIHVDFWTDKFTDMLNEVLLGDDEI